MPPHGVASVPVHHSAGNSSGGDAASSDGFHDAVMSFMPDPYNFAHTIPGFVGVLHELMIFVLALFCGAVLINAALKRVEARPHLAVLATTVLMPLCGAIPDEAIMIVCGISSNAQEQLNVAVGTLSGCVVMLLTLPWAGLIYVGRQKINDRYTLEEHGWWRYTLFSTGINMDEHTRHQAKGLMACSIVYLLAQIPGLRSGCAAVDIAGEADCDSNAAERACAMIGSVLSFLFLGYYFKKQLSINSRGFEEHQRQLLPDNYQAASDAGDVNVPLPHPPPAVDKEVQLIPMMKRPSLWIAALMLLMGAVIVCIYTVPLVDCLGTLSDRATISPFYASFLLVPIATNVAEFVVAFDPERVATQERVRESLQMLQGSAFVGSMLTMGTFLQFVFWQGVSWRFAAETLAIVVVQGIVCAATFMKYHNVFTAALLLSLYPLSMLLVSLMQRYGHIN